MKALICSFFFALALVAASPALAQLAGTVEGMQMPAWVQRAGGRLPLFPGTQLRAGDQVVTGAGGRLLIKLAEGSAVKLGENAQMTFTEVAPSKDLFKAVINVLQGAFRFTTDVVSKAQTHREVTIRAAQVTAGIRGTDLWGRSRPGNEIFCLFEGEIQVGAEGEAAVTLNQPNQFYRRLDGKTQPVGAVDAAQLTQWSAETELQTGKGLLRSGGRYNVVLGSFAEQSAALALHDELRKAGYPAEMRSVKDAGKAGYQVRIRSLASRSEAEALGNSLRAKFGISEPRVSG